jgi:hypothetical protein
MIDTPDTEDLGAEDKGERGRILYRFRLGGG